MSSISQRRTDMGGEAASPQRITQGKALDSNYRNEINNSILAELL